VTVTNVVELPLAGDYNNNGEVDAADYVLWRNGGPLQNEGASPGVVDQADYDLWRADFGRTRSAASGAGAFVDESAELLPRRPVYRLSRRGALVQNTAHDFALVAWNLAQAAGRQHDFSSAAATAFDRIVHDDRDDAEYDDEPLKALDLAFASL
jgi:hypothetical protein